jgi:hypothetical protein
MPIKMPKRVSEDVEREELGLDLSLETEDCW